MTMEINEMTLSDIETRRAEIESALDAPDADLDALEEEIRGLNERERALKGAATLRRALEQRIAEAPVDHRLTGMLQGQADQRESRAAAFVQTGRLNMDVRTLLGSGDLAKPTGVTAQISELPAAVCSIVDDVKAERAEGTGSWTVPYRKTASAAADVTEGSAVSGTEGTFGTVTINPATWGIFAEVSNMVGKYSPVDYTAAIERDAYLALRKTAKAKITAAITGSSLAEKVTIPIDADYLRTLVLGFDADESVAGGTKLYLCKADLQALGKVRGTNEKRPIYEIHFDDENNGTISEGGTMVRFSINSSLSAGTQLYGQPQTVVMPMWGQYEVETDGGGDFFKRNVIGIRGLQTAGAALCAHHGMQVVTNAAAGGGSSGGDS